MTTHKQLAERLGVSINAVAVTREVLGGTSDQSQRALAETEVEHIVAAAKWLALYRKCYAVAGEITKEVVKEVMANE